MNDTDFKEDFDEIFNWIAHIGEVEGAIPELFRDEADAQALPPEFQAIKQRQMLKELGYNLRLYCLRISRNIVILLNGGAKESQKVQDSPDLFSKFRWANQISKVITEKILRRELRLEGRRLKGDFELQF